LNTYTDCPELPTAWLLEKERAEINCSGRDQRFMAGKLIDERKGALE